VPPPVRGRARRGRRATARVEAPRRRRHVGAPAHAFRRAAGAPSRCHARLHRCLTASAPPRRPRCRGIHCHGRVRREAPRGRGHHPPHAWRVVAPRRHIRARVRRRRLPRPPHHGLLHAHISINCSSYALTYHLFTDRICLWF
jgi:hypothetical protein